MQIPGLVIQVLQIPPALIQVNLLFSEALPTYESKVRHYILKMHKLDIHPSVADPLTIK